MAKGPVEILLSTDAGMGHASHGIFTGLYMTGLYMNQAEEGKRVNAGWLSRKR